jgi:Tfp pilus assembly protein FimT
LGRHAQSSTRCLTAESGYSTLELAVALSVILVLLAIAIPSLSHMLAVYQMNDAATRLAGILKFTRYEAIRLNHQVNGTILASGSDWWVFADTNNNGVADPTETVDLIKGSVTLLPAAGMPATTPITTQLGNSAMTLTSISAMNATVTFDSRGSVLSGGNNTVYVLYLGNTTNLSLGYRAVVLLPSGMVHIWTAGQSGPWVQVS